MFEQERYASGRRPRSVFQTEEAPGAGMSRYQVSGAGDPAEAAAEQAADSAVGGGSIFRAPEGADVAGFTADLSDADLGGIGTPLPDDLMGSMEQSLGASFAGVRLHTDAGADRASRQLSARAFTRGQDVYFRDGAYSPDTSEGQHLIAHELAHVAAGDGGIHGRRTSILRRPAPFATPPGARASPRVPYWSWPWRAPPRCPGMSWPRLRLYRGMWDPGELGRRNRGGAHR